MSFIEPAGLYQQLERASKYGFLFIGLTFAAFLLFELLRRLAIHPIQYALVGLALAMFFLLLTALSEHIAFTAAYAAATLACVGLVTGYLVRALKSARAGLAFGGALAALYAMLYALLKAEDYSLLGGALLLFGLLAGVMVATRRVDWYALSGPRAGLENKKARSPGLFFGLRGDYTALMFGRGRAFAGAHFEGDLLAFLQRLVAVHLDRGVVGEQILAAVIRRDEAETLGVVEPLHGTCSHCHFPSLTLTFAAISGPRCGHEDQGRN